MKLGISLPQGLGHGDLLEAVDALTFQPSHVSVWSSWDYGSDGPPGAAFPTREVRGLTARGIRPVVFWQPAGPASDHRTILRGDHDAYIDQWARDAADWGGTVLVRFAWEQNGHWRNRDGTYGMPWGVFRNGNTAASYVSMWRHVVGRVRAIAPRALFWWCPDVMPSMGIPATWPGADFVDRAGLDGYAWEDPLKDPQAIYGPALAAVRVLTDRPVLIGEYAAAAGAAGRTAWFRDTVEWFEDHGITAALWFNIDMREHGHPDWRIGDGIRTAWEQMVAPTVARR